MADSESNSRRQRPPPKQNWPPVANTLKALPIINKDIFRNMVWDTLDSANLVRFPRHVFPVTTQILLLLGKNLNRPCKGRIPNFHGHNRAANRLSKTKEYVEARTVKVNSSLAQEKVRYLSLWDRKMLYVPCPTTQVSPTCYLFINQFFRMASCGRLMGMI